MDESCQVVGWDMWKDKVLVVHASKVDVKEIPVEGGPFWYHPEVGKSYLRNIGFGDSILWPTGKVSKSSQRIFEHIHDERMTH